MSLLAAVKKLFAPSAPSPAGGTPPGLYPFMRERDGRIVRFHLRVEPDGRGFLIVNATGALRLSPTGVLMARGLLEEQPEETVVQAVQDAFRGTDPATLARDVGRVRDLLDELARPNREFPVVNLQDPLLTPQEAQLMAPLRADLPMDDPERLAPLVMRLWEIGVPHVAFVAYQYDPAEQLARVLEQAEDLGMIAGLRTTASQLMRPAVLENCLQAGVDHITVMVAGADARRHDALLGDGDFARLSEVLVRLRQEDVCTVAELPLTAQAAETLDDTVGWLAERGVLNYSLCAFVDVEGAANGAGDGPLAATALPQVLVQVEEDVEDVEGRFFWQPPRAVDRRRELLPQVRQGPRCSGDVSIRVDSDGAVYPPRGPRRPAGNLLQDRWEQIWSQEPFRIFREKVEHGEDFVTAQQSPEQWAWEHDEEAQR